MTTTLSTTHMSLAFPGAEPMDFNADSPRKRTRYTAGTPDTGPKHIDFEHKRQAATLPRSQSDTSRLVPIMSSVPARSRRRVSPDKPRYDSAAAAAAAATGQVDGYKPREERSWEEFHPDFDIETTIPVLNADEVDGIIRPSAPEHGMPYDFEPQERETGMTNRDAPPPQDDTSPLTPRKHPNRPPRRGESMLSGLGSPPAPRIVPMPSHNPRERLNLPKPSYRKIETFAVFEADRANQVNYVDKTMAHVGFQESELYFRPDGKLVRLMENPLKDDENDLGIRLETDKQQGMDPPTHSVGRVEYDMDEQDERWLEALNAQRKEEQVDAIKPAVFEITMTQVEKEWHALERRIPKPNPKPPQTHRPRSSSAAAVNGEPAAPGEEQDSKCAICDDGDCENTNAIVFCDGCDLAVHQECYGVPFIPEGQWLCRKCQTVGKSLPACVFCPNTEGAFKLTHEQRWAHLLCAIWIPEVTLGNPTFMEPIMDVAKVPKSRWKLSCYICNQKMGACIQCGHKFCFLAFHVTCARKAKLHMKMKSTHGGPFSLDASVLKAFCDKHVPAEWARDNDVTRATALVKERYKRTMKGRRWADSQASALALLPSQGVPASAAIDKPVNGDGSTSQGETNSAAQRKRPQQVQKSVWRLPSGAPVVPQVVFDVVEFSLQRFTVRKRKEFVAEACKYWTLKREARRGAALLKRLQLQLESFSSSEITRRNFAAMGVAGGSRLQRRIDLADELLRQLSTISETCNLVKEREGLKLRDIKTLGDVVDTVYYPIIPLLEIVLRKASSLDPKAIFATRIRPLYRAVRDRQYTSVATFSRDLGHVYRTVPGLENVSDVVDAHNNLAKSLPRDEELTPEQKDIKRLAKRIVKAVQQPLFDAFGKEAELAGKKYEEGSIDVSRPRNDAQQVLAVATNGVAIDETEQPLQPQSTLPTRNGADEQGKPTSSTAQPTHTDSTSKQPLQDEIPSTTSTTFGGIPWYICAFDPVGTTIHEERWTGRDVLRGMSEQLSEIDDAELKQLGPPSDAGGDVNDVGDDEGNEVDEDAEEAKKKHQKALAKRRRRYHGRW